VNDVTLSKNCATLYSTKISILAFGNNIHKIEFIFPAVMT
jgi:hypothetical protein